MNQFSIDPFLLIRSPAYSYQNFTEQFLQEALKTDRFRAALFFASQTLYLELRKKNFAYEQLSPAARVTIWKYLNRMCFRALPYGFFSSFSCGYWSDDSTEFLQLTGEGRLLVHPDFKVVADYVQNLPVQELPHLKYYTNNSLYRSARELRFLSQAYSASNKCAIVQLKIVPGLNQLLRFISTGQTRDAIISYLKAAYGEDAPAAAYFESLLAGQVIFSELNPNVTGTRFSKRCQQLLSLAGIGDDGLLSSFEQRLQKNGDDLSALTKYMETLMRQNTGDGTYSLYQREVCGGLGADPGKDLVALIRKMDKLTANDNHDQLKRFRTAFLKKYDQQEVPLMLVMDPGSGIGYENLASTFDVQDDGFVEDLHAADKPELSARWGAVEKMIFKKWNALRESGTGKILITMADLEALPASTHTLPPGMFVLFKTIDRELWIDAIGGVSGIELSARFAAEGSEMEANLRRICEHEIRINDDFIFAELAFSPNDRTANINQRSHFFAYEIPVLSHSTCSEEQLIKLSDLQLSVREDRIFLRSARLNRYIIPRLSSAYNYKLSTIPVFRFLCDLQHQGLKPAMSLSLPALFPGMDYYPRLQVDNAVISPATWVLYPQQILDITQNNAMPGKVLGVPQYFSLNEGDNFLIFNQEHPAEMEIFRKCIKNKSTVKLTEYAFARHPDLRDISGKPFAGQFVACVLNHARSYHLPLQHTAKDDRIRNKVKRSFLPGEEWLYLKVYTHTSLSDQILLSFVVPLVKKYRKDNPGFKWFFIRYQDPGNHLRLRFFTAERSSYQLLSDLMVKLRSWSEGGMIADMLLDTYQRELEKYSAGLISEVESFFYRNSDYILSVFSAYTTGTSFKLSFAVNSSLQTLSFFIPAEQERSDFLQAALHSMSGEFDGEKEVGRKLDVKYRKFQEHLINNGMFLSDQPSNPAYRAYKKQAEVLALQIRNWDQVKRYKLLINLVHLHVNRIFENTPREYEFLIYHFMKKHQAYLHYTTSGKT